MNQSAITEAVENVKRNSHRAKNAGNLPLFKKGERIARKISRSANDQLARQYETEYLELVKKEYQTRMPLPEGITTQKILNASGYEAAVESLQTAADNAFDKYPDACNQSVSDALSALGNNDLNGKVANDQVDYMSNNWTAVDAETAQKMANEGQVVVAGLQNPSGDGHVALVVPEDADSKGGKKPDGNYYPLVEGGGSTAGKSDGTLTAGDVWPASPTNPQYRGNVKYYTPTPPKSK